MDALAAAAVILLVAVLCPPLAPPVWCATLAGATPVAVVALAQRARVVAQQ